MWLKRILKNSATGPAGGGGGDLGVAGDNVMGIGTGQGSLFQDEGSTRNQEERQNAQKRRQKRKKIERHRKWRLSKDQQ